MRRGLSAAMCIVIYLLTPDPGMGCCPTQKRLAHGCLRWCTVQCTLATLVFLGYRIVRLDNSPLDGGVESHGDTEEPRRRT